jgi:hypothetical protein
MFDDEDDDNFEGTLGEDLERFEAHLKGDVLGFIDSDKLEAIIDHYLINNQYNKERHKLDEQKSSIVSAVSDFKNRLQNFKDETLYSQGLIQNE